MFQVYFPFIPPDMNPDYCSGSQDDDDGVAPSSSSSFQPKDDFPFDHDDKDVPLLSLSHPTHISLCSAPSKSYFF